MSELISYYMYRAILYFSTIVLEAILPINIIINFIMASFNCKENINWAILNVNIEKKGMLPCVTVPYSVSRIGVVLTSELIGPHWTEWPFALNNLNTSVQDELVKKYFEEFLRLSNHSLLERRTTCRVCFVGSCYYDCVCVIDFLIWEW